MFTGSRHSGVTPAAGVEAKGFVDDKEARPFRTLGFVTSDGVAEVGPDDVRRDGVGLVKAVEDVAMDVTAFVDEAFIFDEIVDAVADGRVDVDDLAVDKATAKVVSKDDEFFAFERELGGEAKFGADLVVETVSRLVPTTDDLVEVGELEAGEGTAVVDAEVGNVSWTGDRLAFANASCEGDDGIVCGLTEYG